MQCLAFKNLILYERFTIKRGEIKKKLYETEIKEFFSTQIKPERGFQQFTKHFG